MKLVLGLLLSMSIVFAMGDFRMVPAKDATILQKGKNKNFCPVCGMTLPFFYKTNHAATHNGEHKQYCSVVCLAEDKIKNKKDLKNFKVVDTNSLKFIDSKKAYFVIGSEKPGTMSHISKYGFSTKAEADKFADSFGGEVMNFDTLFKKVSDNLEADIAATKKKQAMAAKKGGMIYDKVCKKTDLKFNSIADAKSYIMENELCGNLKGKKLQMVGIYLYKR